MEIKLRPPRIRNIRQSAETFFKSGVLDLRLLNQGYYSHVFYVELENNPLKLIAKVFKNDGIIEKESMQLDFIKKHSDVKVPDVYGMSFSEDNGHYDILFEEYIPGISAAGFVFQSASKKDRFCRDVINNLMELHSIANDGGFGELNSERFEKNWDMFYRNIIQNIYNTLLKYSPEFVKENNTLLLNMIEKRSCFIGKGPEKSTFVHGDFNLWNILINVETEALAGIIDPLDCGFSDPDIDLMQLLSVDREKYGFLELYRANGGIISDVFENKIRYYRFWDNLKHLAVTGRYDEKLFFELSAELTQTK